MFIALVFEAILLKFGRCCGRSIIAGAFLGAVGSFIYVWWVDDFRTSFDAFSSRNPSRQNARPGSWPSRKARAHRAATMQSRVREHAVV
jgi:hypothetical protein